MTLRTGTDLRRRRGVRPVRLGAAAGGGGSGGEFTILAAASGLILSESNAGYQDARTDAGALIASTPEGNVGQDYFNDEGTDFWRCTETFLSFNTSAITGTPVSATLSIWTTDFSTTDFTIEARLLDWGASLTTADWVPGDTLSQTLLASRSTAGLASGAYNALTNVAMVANLNLAGFTRFLLCSSRHRNNDEPTGAEYVAIDGSTVGRVPKLVVVTS